MYWHTVMHINYKIYDVQCVQDVVNHANSHHNIMLLSVSDPNARLTSEANFYRYAPKMCAYHVNVIYVGPGCMGYQSQQMEFLWVWWYDIVGTGVSGWKNSRLDQLHFPPVTHHDAFGFVDPLDILRGCHIIPRFAFSLQHPDGLGISYSRKDSDDWQEYYVNQ